VRPLNGKSAMTPDERNARRRELDKDPFHRELTRKTQRKWRKKNKAKLNKRRRDRMRDDPEYREAELERGRRWRAEHKDAVKRSWQKWASRNRDYLREKEAARAKTPEEAERRRRYIEKRRKRLAEDPEYAAHVRKLKRESYHRMKHTEKGLRWMMKCIWEPRWRAVVAEGPDAVKKYLNRCKPRTKHYFAAWYSRTAHLIDRTSPQTPDSELLRKNS